MTVLTYDNILAIDTATMHLKLALAFGKDRLVKSDNLMDRTHGQVIIKKIDELLKSAGLDKRELDAIVVCLGPGSFTGIRIGLAATKGIAVALGVSVIGVSLFDVAAYTLRHVEDTVVILMPHRREELFMATVERGVYDTAGVKTVAYEKLPSVVSGRTVKLIGINPEKIPPELTVAKSVRVLEYDASDLLSLGIERLSHGQTDDIALLEPLYLQKSQAEIRFDERQKKK